MSYGKGSVPCLAGSTGSSIASTAQGAGDAADSLYTAIIRTSGHKEALLIIALPSESATPHTCHGCSQSGERS
jgi:hypothetical protein